MINEKVKKAGLTSAFAASIFAIVAATTASVSPVAAETLGGSFSTRVQELNHASGTDRSGYYAYSPYSYAEMATAATAPQTASPSNDANGSFSSRIQGIYRF